MERLGLLRSGLENPLSINVELTQDTRHLSLSCLPRPTETLNPKDSLGNDLEKCAVSLFLPYMSYNQ